MDDPIGNDIEYELDTKPRHELLARTDVLLAVLFVRYSVLSAMVIFHGSYGLSDHGR